MLNLPVPEDVEEVDICLVLEPKQFEVVQLDVTRTADNQRSLLVAAANMTQAVRRKKRGQKLKTKKSIREEDLRNKLRMEYE